MITERELRDMARQSIDRHPYIRFFMGQFPDPEQASIEALADGIFGADRPGSPLHLVMEVYDRVVRLPGGREAVATLDEELVFGEIEPMRSRYAAKQLSRRFNAFLIKRLLGLRKIEDRLTKGDG